MEKFLRDYRRSAADHATAQRRHCKLNLEKVLAVATAGQSAAPMVVVRAVNFMNTGTQLDLTHLACEIAWFKAPS